MTETPRARASNAFYPRSRRRALTPPARLRRRRAGDRDGGARGFRGGSRGSRSPSAAVSPRVVAPRGDARGVARVPPPRGGAARRAQASAPRPWPRGRGDAARRQRARVRDARRLGRVRLRRARSRRPRPHLDPRAPPSPERGVPPGGALCLASTTRVRARRRAPPSARRARKRRAQARGPSPSSPSPRGASPSATTGCRGALDAVRVLVPPWMGRARCNARHPRGGPRCPWCTAVRTSVLTQKSCAAVVVAAYALGAGGGPPEEDESSESGEGNLDAEDASESDHHGRGGSPALIPPGAPPRRNRLRTETRPLARRRRRRRDRPRQGVRVALRGASAARRFRALGLNYVVARRDST